MAKAKRKRGALYFTGIDRTGPDSVVLTGSYYALEESDERRTALLSLKGGVWGALDVSGMAHAVRLWSAPDAATKQYAILSRDHGLYRITPPKKMLFDRIHEDRGGFLMDLRRIAGSWYAVGGHNQAYRLDGAEWTAIDAGMYVAGEKGEGKLLNSIDGTSGSDLYVAGLTGSVLHFDGKRWKAVGPRTNVGFERVLCVGKEVFLCGHTNALYRGNAEGWELLSEPSKDVLWDMAYFKRKLYVCSKHKLFVLGKDGLSEVKLDVPGPLGFFRMAADDNELWTCGNECVLQFDGKTWKQHVFPDNE